MIRARAGFRQAEGDIHRLVEIEKLERDQALVMIHCQHRVEFAAGGITENRVGNVGSGEGGDA